LETGEYTLVFNGRFHTVRIGILGVIDLGKTNEDKKKDPKFIALGARVGAEHGADLLAHEAASGH